MTILDLSNKQAKDYFFDPQNYFCMELPDYFDFPPVLKAVSKALKASPLKKADFEAAKEARDVNYILYSNKDGKYAWRPIQFIHPVLYVNLVNELTNARHWAKLMSCFEAYGKLQHIKCASLPVVREKKESTNAEQILSWWSGFEQESLARSFQYQAMFVTDITDCYGSICTHSIARALNGKDGRQSKDRNAKLAASIEEHIAAMSSGKITAIPQASVLMHFIAELVLGYIDLQVEEKLAEKGVSDYSILRYRDDYRIFVNDTELGKCIVNELAQTLSSLGMRLNSSKTRATGNIVRDSIKDDKLAWLALKGNMKELSFEKKLLLIYQHADHYPNGGSILQPLVDLHKEFNKKRIGGPEQIWASAAILTELAYRNPRCYQVCTAILSQLMNCMKDNQRATLGELIMEKFKRLPHTGELQVWLQRIMAPNHVDLEYTERLCQVVNQSVPSLWNNAWLKGNKVLFSAMKSADIVNRAEIGAIHPVVSQAEINIFIQHANVAYFS